MALSSTLKVTVCVANELRYAVQGVERANQSEEEHVQGIVAVITLCHCLQSIRQHQATEAHSIPLIDALQQTLMLGGLKADSRHAMVNALSGLCRRIKALPRHVKINASSAAAICLGPHRYITQLPNKDVFHKVPHKGRLVQIERYRLSNTEQLIHDIILRFNYHNAGLLPFEGVHQDAQGDFRATYLISQHCQHGGIRDYTFNRWGVDRLSLLKALLKALDFLHSNRIAHGRIKPSAVAVDDTGGARLSGLGLGVLASADGGVSPVMSGCLPFGEYLWMSPELLRAHRDGEPAIPTPASDLYSFALVAYELCTGEKPFPEIRARRSAVIGIQKLFKAVIDNDERPTRPAETSAAYMHYGMTDDIWSMIEDCWVPDPTKRPSARDILKRPFMIVADL